MIFEAGERFEPVDWSPDGDYLLIEGIGVFGDLWLVPTEGGADPLPFVATPEAEYSGRFSPAGRWIAYVSRETGRPEIYVKPWPTGAGRWQISTDGGNDPRWRGDGKELFYRDADRQLMSVSVEVSQSGSLQRGLPRALFEATGNSYEPSPDGQRFLFIESGEEANMSPATVVLNWPALLEDDD